MTDRRAFLALALCLDDDTTEGFVRIVGPKGQDRVTLGKKD